MTRLVKCAHSKRDEKKCRPKTNYHPYIYAIRWRRGQTKYKMLYATCMLNERLHDGTDGWIRINMKMVNSPTFDDWP